jgi:hypothetical protein
LVPITWASIPTVPVMIVGAFFIASPPGFLTYWS